MKKILLLSMSLALVLCTYAQRTVSGKVTDSGGEGLPGVTVVIKGTTNGTTTDIDGNYQLQVDGDDAVLVFSSVGMETQEVAVSARSVIDVELSENTTQLQEVVVTAFGIEKERKELGYAVTTVGGDEGCAQGAFGGCNRLVAFVGAGD